MDEDERDDVVDSKLLDRPRHGEHDPGEPRRSSKATSTSQTVEPMQVNDNGEIGDSSM